MCPAFAGRPPVGFNRFAINTNAPGNTVNVNLDNITLSTNFPGLP